MRDEEEFAIELEGDIEELKAESKWVAVARVNSDKPFSHAAFFANTHYAWGLAKKVSCKTIGENLFAFQFFCLGDWVKVMDEGPWIIRGYAVMLEVYDGVSKPSSVVFKNLVMWVRLYDLPTAFWKESIRKKLASRIGEVLRVELDDGRGGWRQYLRVRVKIEVDNPLVRVVNVATKKA